MEEFLKELVYAVIIAVVPIIATYICKWLHGLYESNKDKIADQKVSNALDRVISMVSNAVITTTNTYVNSLKKDNVFDKEAQVEAFNKTKNAVMAQLTDELAEAIEQTYGDVDVYLNNLIERLVADFKNQSQTLQAATVEVK